MTLLPGAFSLSVEHHLSIRQLISWSIRWRAMCGKSTARITGEKREILKGRRAKTIPLYLPRWQSRCFHLQIIALLIPLHVLSLWVNATKGFFLGWFLEGGKHTVLSSENVALSSTSASFFYFAPPGLDQSIGVTRFVSSLQSRGRSQKATVCFIDKRGRAARWVNTIDLGMWERAKINSAEGMIKLTPRSVLHHQLFGLWSQILLGAKVRHLGFTGCVSAVKYLSSFQSIIHLWY